MNTVWMVALTERKREEKTMNVRKMIKDNPTRFRCKMCGFESSGDFSATAMFHHFDEKHPKERWIDMIEGIRGD
jgi:hypothetical protein